MRVDDTIVDCIQKKNVDRKVEVERVVFFFAPITSSLSLFLYVFCETLHLTCPPLPPSPSRAYFPIQSRTTYTRANLLFFLFSFLRSHAPI